jgi:thymidine kinase
MPEENQQEPVAEQKDTNTPDIEKDGIRTFIEYYFPELIEEHILEAYENIEQTDGGKLFPPYPENAEIPIDKYSAIHRQIHKQLSKDIVNSDWEVLVLESGMFGGKSSLGFDILKRLKERGYSTGLFISAVMGEDFVTARSYPDGEQIRKAVRYGKDAEEKDFKKIPLPPKEYYIHNEQGKLVKIHNEKRVVLLDEFSFADEESLHKYMQKCHKEHVKVILTGLNTNYLGDTLEPFKHLDRIIGKAKYKRVECKSFVPGIDNDEPTGTKTVRYLNIGGRWILDLGISKLVTSKEEINKSGKHIALYRPGTEEMTVVYLLRKYPGILNRILHPTEEGKERQEKRFLILKESSR